ncbi:male sterility protein-domain-containing protein [Mycena rebaudengoi]|nr:male sterility protein-domain-containing protein [Mycena rebaudengoi]KAJ7248356.1 male sterility protein-domain-containing protein [Mycena rebaudengoi]
MNIVDYEVPSAFFKKHVVLLTGGTGGLGACILFKLALQVDTDKIYVLVRGSIERAKSQWAASMSGHIDRILATGRVELLVGDVREKHLGLDPGVLAELAGSVTLVIHCAANISLMASLNDTIRDNCLPTLELAKLASGFKNLSRFVHVSTAYVNAFLPAGSVEEKIYETRDAEKQLAEILETGSASPTVEGFPSPYAFAKHLTERLLFLRYPRLALLIFRPTIIGPAISQPFPYYERDGSAPESKIIEKCIEAGISDITQVFPSHLCGGTNILDEIPVDLAANLLLLHCMHGSTGVVHACAQSYILRTFSQVVDDIVRHTRQVNASTHSGRAGTRFSPLFYAVVANFSGKDWRFSNAASRQFANVGGPLGMKLHDHDPEKFFTRRSKLIAERVRAKAAAKLGVNRDKRLSCTSKL